jgi:DUF1680 family protein
MRTLASVPTYLATATEHGLQVHQYAASSLRAGEFAVDIDTAYPWDGRITVTVREAPGREVELALRVPDWAEGSTVDGTPVNTGGYAKVRRVFGAGERIVLVLPMPARVLVADDRIDATRGCVALARGPLVYALEEPDQPSSATLEDLRIDPSNAPRPEHRPDLLDGVTVLHADGAVTGGPASSPYRPRGGPLPPTRPTTLTLIPYYAWANRGPHAMRVWIPTV